MSRMGENEMQMVETIRSTLDARAESLDDDTLVALRSRRREAIASTPARSHRGGYWLAGSGALFASLLVALVIWSPRPPDPQRLPQPVGGLPMEMVVMEGDIELYRDLEFYQWLEANHDQNG